MISWVLLKSDGKWGLYIRDYPCQGINPDYILFKSITEDTARYLADNHLADDQYDRLRK